MERKICSQVSAAMMSAACRMGVAAMLPRAEQTGRRARDQTDCPGAAQSVTVTR